MSDKEGLIILARTCYVVLITKLFKRKHVHVKKKMQSKFYQCYAVMYRHVWLIAVFVRSWMGHILEVIYQDQRS